MPFDNGSDYVFCSQPTVGRWSLDLFFFLFVTLYQRYGHRSAGHVPCTYALIRGRTEGFLPASPLHPTYCCVCLEFLSLDEIDRLFPQMQQKK